jgi:erythromycin esterase
MKRNSRLLAGSAVFTAVAVSAAVAVAPPAHSTLSAAGAPSSVTAEPSPFSATSSASAGSTTASSPATQPGRDSAGHTGQRAYDPVPALNRAAYPIHSTEATGSLYDLRPLNRMVGNASVVGIGEATHNSREFFTLRDRIFRSLVAEKGFTTFAHETSWSTGVSLDRYITTGVGDPREIMRREFQGSYLWNVREFLEQIEWMREYNKHHAIKLRFVGVDLNYVGPEVLDRVTDFVGETRPELLQQVTDLYAGIRSTAEVQQWTEDYVVKPLAERVQLEAAARQVMTTVASLPPSTEQTWALQHARAAWQVAKLYSFDFSSGAPPMEAFLFRDQVMAENVAWWNRVTGDKVVAGAHNGHIGYEGSPQYPKTQGAFLREQLGKRYVTIGLSFDRGSFNANDADDPEAGIRTFTIGSAPAGNNEYTLDRVRYDDYVVDLRTLPRQTREWLMVERPTRDIGNAYPSPDLPIALGASYDLLIHLDTVTAADRLSD